MQQAEQTPRPEHPRPDFMRDTFMNLNGVWQFSFDDADEGMRAQWYEPGHALPLFITVPFCYQCKASGIGSEAIHPVLWYRRSFKVPAQMANKRIFLRFGAVDYFCTVFINGQHAGEHKGGYTPFALDVTRLLREGENDLCLRVEDYPDCTQPRGKQYWDRGLMGCWYTPVSGIWQTVYLEAAGDYYLTQIHVTPDVDRGQAHIEMALNRFPDTPLTADVEITFQGKPVKRLIVGTSDRQIRIPVDLTVRGELNPIRLWQPGDPNLYDLSVRILGEDREYDHVTTYFGMRKVRVENGLMLLNNSPEYQQLVLDQGYWPDTLLTPPSDEAIRKDIELTMALGFNGARKHQKLEDPRYYYWADKLGLLVWGEVPSAYDFTDETVRNLADTFLGFIDRDFNHPSIVAWVPLNESWGVRQIYTDKRQQAMGRMLYHMGKAADGTRLISSNDGWEHVTTDICALHDYTAEKELLAKHFESRETVEKTACDWRMTYVSGEAPGGSEVLLVTEFGGIGFSAAGTQAEAEGRETWGYHGKAASDAEFLERLRGVMDAVQAVPYCQGYCYTQLTDVLQEINGLLTPNRIPKAAIESMQALIAHPDKNTSMKFFPQQEPASKK